ncbi:MAG: radical SAM protein, partial [Sphaerochaetaceae bacterium]
SYDTHYNGSHFNFPDLLALIANRVDSIKWIRFESPHPKDFSFQLIDVIASERSIARHLHIPAQSGSTRVLEAMNRCYTREQYLALIGELRAKVPHLTLTTDVMVGFPSESEAEFRETLSLMEEVAFLEAFMYYFNPREGTAAASFSGQLSSAIKMGRLQELIDLQRSITKQYKEERCHGEVEVLVEQVSKRSAKELLGRTEHGEMVAFEPAQPLSIGEFTTVTLTGLVGNTYKGTHH